MEKLRNIFEAVDYLKSGETCITNEKHIIKFRNNGYRISLNGANYRIKEDEFKELFSKMDFYLYESKDMFIDPKKDEEYYSFKHK